jgi:hypothetical protein
MVGYGYRNKYTTSGNDSRGIDVGIMMREETADGQKIEFVRMTSHAHVTYEMLGLHTPELAAMKEEPYERIFRRGLPGDRRQGRRRAFDDLSRAPEIDG